jgi:predicted phage terminase large subunit-like protein
MYVTDVYYTQEDNTITEKEVANMLDRNRTGEAVIESNSGGMSFGRNVDRESGYKHTIKPFHQGANKESRILTGASELQRIVYFPMNWTTRWPEFARDILKFKKNFKANKNDDAPDALTGCLEHSGLSFDAYDALYRS